MTTPRKAPADEVDLIAAFERVFGPIPRRTYSTPVDLLDDEPIEPDFDPDFEADRQADREEAYLDSRW